MQPRLEPPSTITKVITIFVGLNGVAILLMLFDEMRRVRAWDRDENLLEKTEADDN